MAEDTVGAAEIERLRQELDVRDRIAMRAAAKARRLEDAIALHRSRRLGIAEDVAFLDTDQIDVLLWQELEPTEETQALSNRAQ